MDCKESINVNTDPGVEQQGGMLSLSLPESKDGEASPCSGYTRSELNLGCQIRAMHSRTRKGKGEEVEQQPAHLVGLTSDLLALDYTPSTGTL